MRPDHRALALRRFKLASKAAFVCLVLVTIIHGACSTAPKVITAMQATNPQTYESLIPTADEPLASISKENQAEILSELVSEDPIHRDNVYIAVLSAINTLQLAACTALFVFLSRNPFSKSSSVCLLILAAPFCTQAVARFLLVDGYIYTNYLFIPGASQHFSEQFRILNIIDIPTLVFSGTLFALSFLLAYGQELYIDSEEIA